MSLFSLRATRAVLTAATLAAVLLAGAAGARAATPYQDPFTGELPYIGRTDMGVDVCLSTGDPIRALGDGVVTGIIRNWAGRQPYVWYELSSGPEAGRYVYVAEQITGLPRVGQTLHAGDVIARYAKKGTCIETGWSAADGETEAQATTG
jgi:murein DD-endopeptidase MepM/ murein hydrolase activator NlpD